MVILKEPENGNKKCEASTEVHMLLNEGEQTKRYQQIAMRRESVA